MRKILLDTNAYTGFLKGDEKVLSYLAQADCIYLSVFVLGELFAGFKAGGKDKENKDILQRFLQKSTVAVLEATRETAEIFGLIKDSLRKSEKPIPTNDMWVAAHAIETGSILVTYDTHFIYVSGLRLWDEISSN